MIFRYKFPRVKKPPLILLPSSAISGFSFIWQRRVPSISKMTSRNPTTPPKKHPDTEKTVDSIRSIAKSIRDASSTMRDTVRTLRQSGAIDEITQAIQEAVVATRDTTKEINETARDLKKRGIIRDTASAIEDTTITARQTAETVKGAAQEAKKSAPKTAEISKNDNNS
jgi:uncharacterized protein YjgD (DUF1641 family)